MVVVADVGGCCGGVITVVVAVDAVVLVAVVVSVSVSVSLPPPPHLLRSGDRLQKGGVRDPYF